MNGSQLYDLGNSTANNLGGGATYNTTTGAISAPSYNVYGTNYNNVGTAIGALQSSAPVQYSDSDGTTTPNTITDYVTLKGISGGPVTIHNVADGTKSNDAVNLSQLQAVSNDVGTLDSLAVKYSDATQTLINLGGSGGTKITNLSKGDISINSTDAVNGSQLFYVGDSTASNFGGGAVYNPLTGIISAPTYSVYGSSYNNVGSAISALQSKAPLQYSDSSGAITPNTVTNDVTLQGSGGGPVTIHNVAAGSAPNDAVNVSQLDAVKNNLTTVTDNLTTVTNTVNNLDALAVKVF